VYICTIIGTFLKIREMKIVNSRDFRDNQRRYFDMIDNNEQVIVKRSKNRAYKLVPVSESDMLFDIPEEYRCNPYDISPSGDVFWADKRNVEMLGERLKEIEAGKAGPSVILKTRDDIKNFLAGL